MVQQLVDRRDIDFVLWEQLNCEQFLDHELYQEFTKKTCEMILTEARSLATRELFPTLAEGDQQGVKFDNGAVRVPESFHRVYKIILEAEWNNLGVPTEMGGQGAPEFKVAFAHSLPFLYAMGDTIMAWMLLWRAVTASQKSTGNPKKKDKAFYEGQIKSAEFFIKTELPVTMGKMDAIQGGCAAAMEISDEGFGGL